MIAENLIVWICFSIFIYVIILRQFVLRRRKFKCLRCGRCCRLRVRLSKEDIKRLMKAGKKDFIEDKRWLKRINGYCMFLEIKKGKSKCTVYNHRPDICRWWPLKKHVCDVRCSTYSNRLF